MSNCTSACKAPVANQCHCTGCHRTFRHLGDFEAHRRGPTDSRYCIQPADMGLTQVQSIWASPESHAQAAVVSARLADSRSSTRNAGDSESGLVRVGAASR